MLRGCKDTISGMVNNLLNQPRSWTHAQLFATYIVRESLASCKISIDTVGQEIFTVKNTQYSQMHNSNISKIVRGLNFCRHWSRGWYTCNGYFANNWGEPE